MEFPDERLVVLRRIRIPPDNSKRTAATMGSAGRRARSSFSDGETAAYNTRTRSPIELPNYNCLSKSCKSASSSGAQGEHQRFTLFPIWTNPTELDSDIRLAQEGSTSVWECGSTRRSSPSPSARGHHRLAGTYEPLAAAGYPSAASRMNLETYVLSFVND